jgi:hypothetical protein
MSFPIQELNHGLPIDKQYVDHKPYTLALDIHKSRPIAGKILSQMGAQDFQP